MFVSVRGIKSCGRSRHMIERSKSESHPFLILKEEEEEEEGSSPLYSEINTSSEKIGSKSGPLRRNVQHLYIPPFLGKKMPLLSDSEARGPQQKKKRKKKKKRGGGYGLK